MTQALKKPSNDRLSHLPPPACACPAAGLKPGVNARSGALGPPQDRDRQSDGSVVFQMHDIEVPAEWSQLATDIVVSKYFRKAGVPGTGHETSVRQVVQRLAHTIRTWGEEEKVYFATPEDADSFESELAYMLVHQIGAFNSPVWFNCGLHHEYESWRLGRELLLRSAHPPGEDDRRFYCAPSGLGLLHPVGG
jgi:hypothetical protein